MKTFEDLLNQTVPTTDEEQHHKNLIWCQYNSNNSGFLRYVNKPANYVGALVLYTESKAIAKHLNVHKLVHINWHKDTNLFTVQKYIPREQREQREQREPREPREKDTQATEQTDEKVTEVQDTQPDTQPTQQAARHTTRREKYVTRTQERKRGGRGVQRDTQRRRYTDRSSA